VSSTFLNREDLIQRMTVNTNETIHPDAEFVCTTNDYWIAWHDGLAAVLSANADQNTPCDWVEGAATLDDLIEWIQSGEYEAMEDFDGSDEEWDELVLDSDAHGDDHQHEHGENCHCHHDHH
jgi:hypothetical protein